MKKSSAITLFKSIWEASAWMLVVLLYILVNIFTPQFNVGSIIFILVLAIPLAAAYAFTEYRYARFKERPENRKSSRSVKSELLWGVFTIISVGTWSYIQRDRQDMLFAFLEYWALVRAWYFIIGSAKFRPRQR